MFCSFQTKKERADLLELSILSIDAQILDDANQLTGAAAVAAAAAVVFFVPVYNGQILLLLLLNVNGKQSGQVDLHQRQAPVGRHQNAGLRLECSVETEQWLFTVIVMVIAID